MPCATGQGGDRTHNGHQGKTALYSSSCKGSDKGNGGSHSLILAKKPWMVLLGKYSSPHERGSLLGLVSASVTEKTESMSKRL